LAVHRLNPQAVDTTLPTILGQLEHVFDPLALGLGLAGLIYAAQLCVDRWERQLLSAVDERAEEELHGRFVTSEAARDPHLSAVQRMSELVVLRTETLVQRQVEIWQQALDSAEQRWGELAAAAARRFESSLADAVDRNVQLHAERLIAIENEAASINRKQWIRVHKALGRTVEASQTQFAELARQTDTLLRISEAGNQVVKLERSLNSSLATLSGSQQLQETLVNLSASMSLLNSRLATLTPLGTHVTLQEPSPAGAQAVPPPHTRVDSRVKEKLPGKAS
jgi:hypothetical protein